MLKLKKKDFLYSEKKEKEKINLLELLLFSVR